LASSFWRSDLSDSQCHLITKFNHLFFFLSLTVLYIFYDARLALVRFSRKRSRSEKAMLVLALLHPVVGIIAANLAEGQRAPMFGRVFCKDLYPYWIYSLSAALGLILNPAYLYKFIQPLKEIRLAMKSQHHQMSASKEADKNFSDIVHRNTYAALVSTIGICGVALTYSVVTTALSEQYESKQLFLVFEGLRSLQATLWCTCMFICTLSIWQRKKTSSHDSQGNIQMASSSLRKEANDPELPNLAVVQVSVRTAPSVNNGDANEMPKRDTLV